MATKRIGPPGYSQPRTPQKRAGELRKAKRHAGKLIEYCLWNYQGGRDWYQRASADIRAKYGTDADLFCDILAATSPQCSIKANVGYARDAYDRHKRGLKVEGWIPCHTSNLKRVRDGQPLRGPKVRAFARALRGDAEAIVVDSWMLRACGYNQATAPRDSVRVAHEAVRMVADQMEWTGSETQAAIWVAYRAQNWKARQGIGASYYLEV